MLPGALAVPAPPGGFTRVVGVHWTSFFPSLALHTGSARLVVLVRGALLRPPLPGVVVGVGATVAPVGVGAVGPTIVVVAVPPVPLMAPVPAAPVIAPVRLVALRLVILGVVLPPLSLRPRLRRAEIRRAPTRTFSVEVWLGVDVGLCLGDGK